MLYNLPGEFTNDADISHKAFEKYFKRVHNVVVIGDAAEQLNRECSVFTDDGKYVDRMSTDAI